MSKISQHDAAANKANVTSIFVKKTFLWIFTSL